MAKYKIHTDRPKISKEEAEANMDFDFVLKQSQKNMHSPLYVLRNISRKPKLMRKVILLMIILLVVLFSILDEKQEKNESQDKVENTGSVDLRLISPDKRFLQSKTI